MRQAETVLHDAIERAESYGMDSDPWEAAKMLDMAANLQADNAEDLADLDQAIDAHRKALSLLASSGRRDRISELNLAVTLRLRSQYGAERAEILDRAAHEESMSILTSLRADASRFPTDADIEAKVNGQLLAGLCEHELSFGDRAATTAIEELTQELVGEMRRLPTSRHLLDGHVVGSLLGELRADELAAEVYAAVAHAANALYGRAKLVESRTRIVVDAGTLAIEAAWFLSQTGRLAEAVAALDQSRARWLRYRRAKDSLDVASLRRLDPSLADLYEQAAQELRRLEEEELKDPSALGVRANYPPAQESARARSRVLVTARDSFEKVAMAAHALMAEESSAEVNANRAFATVHLGAATRGSLALVTWPNGSHQAFFDESVTHDDMVRVIRRWEAALLQAERDDTGSLPAREALGGLYDQLYARVALEVHRLGADYLAIVPVGGAAMLPLHLAGSPSLEESFTVSYLPASDLGFGHVSSVQAEDKRWEYAGIADGSELPYSQLEIAASAGMFANSYTQSIEDSAGDLRGVLAHSALVHFACHAKYDARSPAHSTLQVGRANPISLGELLLTEGLQGCRCVIVAACESAMGTRLMDEDLSLSTGFLVAGAESALGCLWPVDDLVCFVVITEFFAALRSASPAAALKLAKKRTLEYSCGEVARLITFSAAREQGVMDPVILGDLQRLREGRDAAAFSPDDVAAFVIKGPPC